MLKQRSAKLFSRRLSGECAKAKLLGFRKNICSLYDDLKFTGKRDCILGYLSCFNRPANFAFFVNHIEQIFYSEYSLEGQQMEYL